MARKPTKTPPPRTIARREGLKRAARKEHTPMPTSLENNPPGDTTAPVVPQSPFDDGAQPPDEDPAPLPVSADPAPPPAAHPPIERMPGENNEGDHIGGEGVATDSEDEPEAVTPPQNPVIGQPAPPSPEDLAQHRAALLEAIPEFELLRLAAGKDRLDQILDSLRLA